MLSCNQEVLRFLLVAGWTDYVKLILTGIGGIS